MIRPAAVLLDVGGVFLLPSRTHIRRALAQVGHSVSHDASIDRAHYLAVRSFPMDLAPGKFLGPAWRAYLRTYAASLEVPGQIMDEAVEHLRNEFTTSALWSQEMEGSRQGLARLASTGVVVGVVSNSDGTIERRLREMEILQRGDGPGVEVACVVDSGDVGVEKPDPGIFLHALDVLGLRPEETWYVGDTPAFDVVGARRAGLRPILLDPFEVNGDYGVPTASSLSDVAAMVEGWTSTPVDQVDNR